MANNESNKTLEKHQKISTLTHDLAEGEICVRSFVEQLYAVNIHHASDVKNALESSEEKLLQECDRLIDFITKEVNNSMDVNEDLTDEEAKSVQQDIKHNMEVFFNKIKAEAYDDIHELRQIAQDELQSRQAPKAQPSKPNTGRYFLISGFVVFVLALLFFLHDRFVV